MQKTFEKFGLLLKVIGVAIIAGFFIWRGEAFVGAENATGILARLMCFMLAVFMVLAVVAHSSQPSDA